MVNSMTGFAARTGQREEYSWSWDLRSLNGKGLDLRMRLPDWVEGLEAAVRARLQKSLARGSVSLGLRVSRELPEGAIVIDPDGLQQALGALGRISAAAEAMGLALAPASAGDVLAMKGVQGQAAQTTDTGPLREALLADFEPLLEDFLRMRSQEGGMLNDVLVAQVIRISELREQAVACLDARTENAATALRHALARVMDGADGVDEARVAQELAMIAVKADITEELDRIAAHVDAARDLLATEGPIGRKLEFLTQEFNREANTLCSKSQDVALTRIGLDLKAVIDQMREQVQNVE